MIQLACKRGTKTISVVGPAGKRKQKGAVTYTFPVANRIANVPARVAWRCREDLTAQLKRGAFVLANDTKLPTSAPARSKPAPKKAETPAPGGG